MAIQVLSQETIDKIAAGEVVERPSSVIKELVENAIDAKATAITVEIRDGGTSFIRVTDNGCGIPAKEIALAFLRHSTSKIVSVHDLIKVATLGFRGEALSSISAVAQVELLTKTRDNFTGVRYCIDGGVEKSLEEVGTPDGTTFLVRNLFYNTPARKKFLKSNTTEGNYIQDLMERLSLSHPEISFKFISNNKMKLHTSGNTNLKDIIYQIYGREIAANLVAVNYKSEEVSISGFIGKPLIARGNRQYENYFINGRYVKSNIITKAIEQGYKDYMMQHRYPFTVLHVRFEGDELDVNVHPTKMELRFSNGEKVYRLFFQAIVQALQQKELIPDVSLTKEKQTIALAQKMLHRPPESFEKNRIVREQESKKKTEKVCSQLDDSKRPLVPSREKPEDTKDRHSLITGRVKAQEREDINILNESLKTALFAQTDTKEPPVQMVKEPMPYERKAVNVEEPQVVGYMDQAMISNPQDSLDKQGIENRESDLLDKQVIENRVQDFSDKQATESKAKNLERPQQLNLFQEQLIERRVEEEVQIIGQIFDTYWILQFEDNLFLVDQHAAHEKVLYERTMRQLKEKEYTSQLLSPPLILTISDKEAELMEQYRSEFEKLGFGMESFGGKEYAINAIPANLFNLQAKELFLEMLDGLMDELGRIKPDMILEKIASMSCKAAIKGNQHISKQEAEELLKELMTLENPYHCPHGRPVLISMSKYELEKKFKRIV